MSNQLAALRLAREWFRHEEAGEGPQAPEVIAALDAAIAAHEAALRDLECPPDPEAVGRVAADDLALLDRWPSGYEIAREIESLLPSATSATAFERLAHWWQELVARKLSKIAAHEAAKPEPVYYEFRPVSGDGEWRRVEPRDRVYGVGEALADIRSYRYEGKPCYEVRALYAAPVAVVSQWLPIETAPKDGSLLLLNEKWVDEPFIGQWVNSANGGRWRASRTHYDTDGNAYVTDRIYNEAVSHWQPLPPAPEMKP